MQKDKLKSRMIFSSILAILVFASAIIIPRLLRPKDRIPKKHYSLEKNGIVRFIDSEEFLASLGIEKVQALPIRNSKLSAVGQIILLIEPPSVTTGGRPHPLHLDEKYSERIGLKKLDWSTGRAFGVADLSSEYKIRAGLPVELVRYGLLASASRGIVRRVLKSDTDKDTQLIVFEIPDGREWYPGTNCRIVFPTLSEKPVGIPKRALLHLGDKDFVFTQNSAEEFRLRTVTVFDENEQTIAVTGLKSGERVLAKGSILLKNFIPELLQLHE